MVRARGSGACNDEDRLRLAAIVVNRNSPQKQVWRVRIILLTADGLGTTEIMRHTGKNKSVVWHWQERFMHAGVEVCCATRLTLA